MKLSHTNEIIIKKALQNNESAAEIEEIKDKIEKLEKEINNNFDEEYIEVIEKCGILEQLKNNIEEILDANQAFSKETEVEILRQSSLIEEYSTIQLAFDKIDQIFCVFSLLYDFFKKIEEVEKNNDFYKSVSNLKRMKQILNYLKKYGFYDAVKILYENTNSNFNEFIKNEIISWIEGLDLMKIGKNMTEIPKTKIFDNFLFLRKLVVNKKFFNIVYASAKLNLCDFITEIINQKRSEILKKHVNSKIISDKNAIKEDFVYIAFSYFLVSKILFEYFPDCNIFEIDVFNAISQINIENHNIFSKLKDISKILNVDIEKVEKMVEAAIFNYFEAEMDFKDFPKSIKMFIINSIKFLDEMPGIEAEFDQLLAQKIDEKLLNYVNHEEVEEESFLVLKEHIYGLLKTLTESKPWLIDYPFKILKKLTEINENFIEDKYKIVVEDLSYSNNISESVEMVLTIKKFLSAEDRKTISQKLLENIESILPQKEEDEKKLFIDALERNFIKQTQNK